MALIALYALAVVGLLVASQYVAFGDRAKRRAQYVFVHDSEVQALLDKRLRVVRAGERLIAEHGADLTRWPQAVREEYEGLVRDRRDIDARLEELARRGFDVGGD